VRAQGWAEAEKAKAQRKPAAMREHEQIFGQAPSARELVRDERQDAQDRRLVSRAIPLRGSGSPCPSDKKARTIDPP